MIEAKCHHHNHIQNDHHSHHDHKVLAPEKWPQGASVSVKEDKQGNKTYVVEEGRTWVNKKEWDGSYDDIQRSGGVSFL